MTRPVIVFDALCVLCSAHAQFVLRHDRARRFLLASMQSEAGAAIYRAFGIDPADPDTLILVEGDRALRDSDAILAIWRALGWPWCAAGMFGIVPRALRDRVYRWVARHRYRLFGRRESCWLPDTAYRSRIL
jgi:predicted DCC family thiol-disulfide oxidoreductase YuxK